MNTGGSCVSCECLTPLAVWNLICNLEDIAMGVF